MSFTHAVSFIFSHMITKHKKVISAMYIAADFYFSIHGNTKFSRNNAIDSEENQHSHSRSIHMRRRAEVLQEL